MKYLLSHMLAHVLEDIFHLGAPGWLSWEEHLILTAGVVNSSHTLDAEHFKKKHKILKK